jgi:hypothetical protein
MKDLLVIFGILLAIYFFRGETTKKETFHPVYYQHRENPVYYPLEYIWNNPTNIRGNPSYDIRDYLCPF